jgi:hypothetical protein
VNPDVPFGGCLKLAFAGVVGDDVVVLLMFSSSFAFICCCPLSSPLDVVVVNNLNTNESMNYFYTHKLPVK